MGHYCLKKNGSCLLLRGGCPEWQSTEDLRIQLPLNAATGRGSAPGTGHADRCAACLLECLLACLPASRGLIHRKATPPLLTTTLRNLMSGILKISDNLIIQRICVSFHHGFPLEAPHVMHWFGGSVPEFWLIAGQRRFPEVASPGVLHSSLVLFYLFSSRWSTMVDGQRMAARPGWHAPAQMPASGNRRSRLRM